MKKYFALFLALTLLLTLGSLNLAVKAEAETEAPVEEATAEETPAEETKEETVTEDFVEWNPTTDGEPDENQVYDTFLNSEPTSLDPARASDNYALSIMANIYEPLVLIHGDKDGNPVFTGGAATWDVSEDGLVYTFHLRDNQWWDGQPVTAQDYEYALKRAIDPATGAPYVYLLSDILNAIQEEEAPAEEIAEEEKSEEDEAATEAENEEETPAAETEETMTENVAPAFDMDKVGVKALDDKTLEITLGAPSATFLQVMAQPVSCAVRKDWIEKEGEAYGSDPDKIMGNGPFKVNEWQHNTKIVLEKADTYWNAANVLYQKVNLPILQDENTLMTAFMNKEIFSVGTTKPEWKEKFAEKEDVINVNKDDIATFFMMFNTKDELFKNVKVRRAFSAALDREDFNETIWFGNNKAATGWVPLTIYVGDNNYREAAGNFIDKLQQEVPDPKALLAEGLSELGMDDKIDNLEVSIILGSTDTWFRTFGEYLQSIFKEVLNVDLKIEQLDWTVFSDRVDKSDYQIGYMAWGSELVEPNAMLLIHADGSPQVGTYWDNEEYNKTVKAAASEVDPAKRLELYIKAESILMDEAPVAPVVHSMINSYRYDFIKNVDDCVWSNIGYRIGYLSGNK